MGNFLTRSYLLASVALELPVDGSYLARSRRRSCFNYRVSVPGMLFNPDTLNIIDRQQTVMSISIMLSELRTDSAIEPRLL